MKTIRSWLMLGCVAVCVLCARTATAAGFSVVGPRILDPDGRDFIIKGVNDRGIKSSWTGNITNDLPAMLNRWGFNLVRLNCRLYDVYDTLTGTTNYSAASPYQTTASLAPVIASLSARRIVSLIEFHDFTGGFYEGTNLVALQNAYRELCDLYGTNSYVWFNVMNEPGTATLESNRWCTVHQEIIRVVRNEKGVNNPIVCDASAWGQDSSPGSTSMVNAANSALLKLATNVVWFDGVAHTNIIFSFHAYDQWNKGTNDDMIKKMSDYVQRIRSNGHCVIIGEYGCAPAGASFGYYPLAIGAAQTIAQKYGVGRIAWAWWGGDNFDLVTSGNGGGPFAKYDTNGVATNLNSYGLSVWNDLRFQPDFGTWATNYMGLSGTNAASDATPAGDGIANSVKYAFGLNAKVSSRLPIQSTTNLLEITFPRRLGSTGIVYSVQGSTSLTNPTWQAVLPFTNSFPNADWDWPRYQLNSGLGGAPVGFQQITVQTP